MIVNQDSLQTLYINYHAAYQHGWDIAEPEWHKIATMIPSGSRTNEYGWLGQFPTLREWVGDRVIDSMKLHGYSITNRDFESTISVNKNDIEDDNYGVYGIMFQSMGQAARVHPDELVFGLMKDSFTELCYDGQPFFDTDHPVLDATGEPQSVSNFGGGTGPAWFLLDTMRPLRPFIWQERQPYQLLTMNDMQDEHVFMRKEYRYGVDGRGNVGLGFWQLGYASKQPLNEANFNAAYQAVCSFTSDQQRPLGIRPNLLVTGPELRAAALEVVKAEAKVLGATNINRDVVDVMSTPWLVGA